VNHAVGFLRVEQIACGSYGWLAPSQSPADAAPARLNGDAAEKVCPRTASTRSQCAVAGRWVPWMLVRPLRACGRLTSHVGM
jgi:hypothetical protein